MTWHGQKKNHGGGQTKNIQPKSSFLKVSANRPHDSTRLDGGCDAAPCTKGPPMPLLCPSDQGHTVQNMAAHSHSCTGPVS